MFPDLLPIEASAGAAPPAPRTTTPALFSPTERAERRFWEFFTAHIRNPNTRLAYLSAVRRFATWCERRGLALDQVEPMVVAAYIEQLSGTLAPATVKQHLAALRMLFDWLVVGQVLPFNPASSVRGPRHVVKTGKTPVLSAKEARALFDGIDVSTLAGLRDRALLGVLVYSFARVSAAVSLRVADYYTQGPRSFFRLHEKGGRYNVVPAHHTAQAYVGAYLEAAGIGEDRRGPLFRSCEPGRRDALQDRAMSRLSALKMIKRRARQAGLPTEICAHSFRGTGITEYLRNGGDLESRGTDRGARVDPHHAALQSPERRDLARRDRAHPHLNASAPVAPCLSGGSCPRIAKQGTRPRLDRSGNDQSGRIRSSLTASIKIGAGSVRRCPGVAALPRPCRGSRPHSARATMDR